MRTRIALFILFLCFTSQAQLRFVKEVDTVAQLQRLNVFDINKTVSVKGYLAAYDGGGGTFIADETSSVVADGGMIIAPTNNVGRWKRVVSGRDYLARWWGPTRTNYSIQAAMNWVSSNGWGRVIVDGGVWTVKSDDSTRLTMRSGVTLTTADDSRIECAINPTNNWILVDFPLDVTDCGVGPARLVGWNLIAPGGDTNKTGVIFSIQDTHNVTLGGIRASNWYSQYADVGSGNENLQMFDQDWQLGAMSFGAYGDGIQDDRRNLQAYAKFCERYGREFFMRNTTNGYLIGGSPGEDVSGGVWFTNRLPVKIRGENTLIKQFYYNPTEGVLPHPSGVFIISSDNCSISGFRFTTVGSFPITETNQSVTGFFVPIQIHNGTNTLVEKCEFDVESGKGISTSGSYTRIRDCIFYRCGVSTGLGNYDDWLFYEATSPSKGAIHSPIGVSIMNNTFFRGAPFKHCVLFSSADDIICTGNKFLEMNCPNPVLVYSGDLGITDLRGSNIYRFSGTVSHNTVTGTNFGLNAAITLRLNTTTNYTPAWFTPSNMYSAFIISENHIYGTGLGIHNGIELIKGNGTKVLNNDVTVTGSPFHPVGNCDGIDVRGNRLESTIGFGVTIPLSEGFEAPPSFSDMVFEDNTIVSPPSDEYAFRNIEPIRVRNFTAHNNRFIFRGAAGSGDAPKVIQLSASEGFVKVTENKFYLTNSMSGRRVATFGGTNNSTLNFSRNESFVLPGSTVTRRGIEASTIDAVVNYNDVGSCEFNGVINLNFQGNVVTSGDAYPYCLETFNVGRASITGNFLTNYFAGSAFCAVIRATNSILEGNTIVGNSASTLVTSAMGKMYVGNNNIINLGVGVPWVAASPPGTVTHTIYERSLHLDTGAFADTNIITFRRNGSPGLGAINTDNWFTTSDRSILYRTYPDNTNDIGGHAFFVNNTNGTQQFAFGAQGSDTASVFRIGDSTNSSLTFLGGLGTNTLFYLDDNRFLQRLTLGANMTFSGGTLNSLGGGGGGTTNDTPWQLDHDANQFSLTNVNSIRLSKNSGSAVSMLMTNTEGSFTTTADGGGVQFDISDNTAVFHYKLNGVALGTWGIAGIKPDTGSQTVGTSVSPWSRAWIGPIGINLGGINIHSGSGSPEGVQTDPVGSFWFRTNGGAGTIIYVKETGVGNTGWTAFKSSAAGTVPETIQLSCSDLTTTIVAGTFKAYFRMPFAMTGVTVRASLAAAQTAGSIFTVDVNETGTTILSTKLTIDNSEKTSTTAATAAVVSDTSLADDAEITVDVDQAGTGPAGLIVTLNGFR